MEVAANSVRAGDILNLATHPRWSSNDDHWWGARGS